MSRKYDIGDVCEVLAYIAIISAIVGACIYGIYCVYKLPKNTVRDWTNTALRHGYCLVRMCDEFHRCPVWDEQQERCIFLEVEKPKPKPKGHREDERPKPTSKDHECLIWNSRTGECTMWSKGQKATAEEEEEALKEFLKEE